MVNLMVAYQDVVVYGRLPEWISLWPVTLLALFFCGWGLLIFRKRSGEMVDEL
jgi:lipopolysaccharide transport system permease protein